jgi:hypothetical protein
MVLFFIPSSDDRQGIEQMSYTVVLYIRLVQMCHRWGVLYEQSGRFIAGREEMSVGEGL